MEISPSTAAAKTMARRDELSLADRAFAGIQGDSRTWVGVDLGSSESATAAAFVPHEPGGVSFVEDAYGARYRRVTHNGLVNYYPEPATPRHPIDFSARFKYGIPKAHARVAELSLTDRALAGTELASHIHIGMDPGVRETTAYGCLANGRNGAGLVGYIGAGTEREWRFTHTDGTLFTKADPARGENYGVWAMKCAEEAERARFAAFQNPCLLKGDFKIDVAPASAEERAARKAGRITLTWQDDPFWSGGYVEGVQASDRPGIAAMAAQNVQPTPEPVLSIAGEQVSEREIAQALQLLRGQSAPAVKETPRGLMCVRDFDHRLGSWGA